MDTRNLSFTAARDAGNTCRPARSNMCSEEEEEEEEEEVVGHKTFKIQECVPAVEASSVIL